MKTRQEIAEEVLEAVRPGVLKLGIELDITCDRASGFTWRAVAYNGKRKSSHIWVRGMEQELRTALREALEDYLSDLTTDALGSFDDALDAHDTARDAKPAAEVRAEPLE